MTTSHPFVVSSMGADEINDIRKYLDLPLLDADGELQALAEMRRIAQAEILTDNDREEIKDGVARLPGAIWKVVFVGPHDDPVQVDNTHGGCANILPMWEADEAEPTFSISRTAEHGGRFYICGLQSEENAFAPIGEDDTFASAKAALNWLGLGMMFDARVQRRLPRRPCK